MKDKKCRQCGKKFKQYCSTQVVCSTKCAIIKAKQDRIKKAKEDKEELLKIRKKKDELKTPRDLVKPAQAAVNSYVRERDYGDPCISSGKEMDWNKFGGAVDAGHFRSRGSAPHLRFNLWNIHAQSVFENRYQSGNAISYRANLIKKIGIEKVEWLEQNHERRSFSKEYLKRITKIFRKRARILKKRRELL